MEREATREETIVITGASAGIGQDLARCFAREGCHLILVARREARLFDLARELEPRASSVDVVALDLSDATSADRLMAAIERLGRPIDVLVNNAGFGMSGPFVESDHARVLSMIQLNVTTLTDLCRRVLPDMMARGRGGILNIASTAGFQPGPTMAVYYATKAYVLSFSEALHEEARRTGVVVCAYCPGPTATEFNSVARLGDPLFFRLTAASSSRVARGAHRAFRTRRAVKVHGFGNFLGTLLVRLTPRILVRKAVRRIMS